MLNFRSALAYAVVVAFAFFVVVVVVVVSLLLNKYVYAARKQERMNSGTVALADFFRH